MGLSIYPVYGLLQRRKLRGIVALPPFKESGPKRIVILAAAFIEEPVDDPPDSVSFQNKFAVVE
jgi:hypothetical protein